MCWNHWRPLLVRGGCVGIPGVPDDHLVLVHVRAYGSKDATRGWYETVKSRVAKCSVGGHRWEEHPLEPAFFKFVDSNNNTKGVCCVHVDDFV